MKLETIKIIACPNCLNSPLEKELFEQNSDGIIEGNLYCSICKKKYPIKEGIPRLLPDISKLDNKYREIMKANLKYHDIAAETYEYDTEEAIHQNEFNQKRIEEIIHNLSQKIENNYFLDVGCGTGNVLKFGQRYFKNAIGTDVSINMLKIAKEKGCEVVQADALSLPFKPNIFNAVSIFSVLHHLYNYELFFSGASRVLKSGGFFYTDWDPLRQPKIKENKISWQIFKLLKYLGAPIKNLLLKSERPSGVNLREIKPELKKLYEISEYHNLALKGEERGLDWDKLKEILIENYFTNIQPTFHWAGKTLKQLPLSLKIRFSFLKFQDYPRERFMENIMIVAQKK
ncbi:MAG: methyltransferase domain-containing protein [Promethearchaeota archaeon]